MTAEEMTNVLVNRERYLYRLYESTVREEGVRVGVRYSVTLDKYEDTSIDVLSRHIEVMKLIHKCGIKNERYDKFLKNSEINIRNAVKYFANKIKSDRFNVFHPEIKARTSVLLFIIDEAKAIRYPKDYDSNSILSLMDASLKYIDQQTLEDIASKAFKEFGLDDYYANRIEEDAIKAWKNGLKDRVTCDPMDCIFSVSHHDIKWLPEGRCQEIVKKLRSID